MSDPRLIELYEISEPKRLDCEIYLDDLFAIAAERNWTRREVENVLLDCDCDEVGLSETPRGIVVLFSLISHQRCVNASDVFGRELFAK